MPQESLALYLTYGWGEPSWQSQLDSFFLGSTEHAAPWAVHGNLQLIAQERVAAAVQHIPSFTAVQVGSK